MSLFLQQNTSYSITYKPVIDDTSMSTSSKIQLCIIPDSTNPAAIDDSTTATIKYYADGTYYGLSNDPTQAVEVTNATITSWVSDGKTGTLTISAPTGAVIVQIKGHLKFNTIGLAEGLTISGGGPVDDRLVLSTNQMKNMTEGLMPNVYFAVNTDDKKLYLYDKSITTPSATTGKFTELSGGGGSLQSELTATYTVGGINAGDVFAAGTSLESILRQLLASTGATLRIGFYNGTVESFKSIDDTTLINNSTPVTYESMSSGTYDWRPSGSAQVFFILMDKTKLSCITDGKLVPAYVSPETTGLGDLSSEFTNSDIVSSNSISWLGNLHGDVTSGGITYKVCGLASTTWNVDTTSPYTNSDKLEINFTSF